MFNCLIWTVMLYTLTNSYKCSEAMYCLHIQGRSEDDIFLQNTGNNIYKTTWHHNPEEYNQQVLLFN